jgi:hypothetical protein
MYLPLFLRDIFTRYDGLSCSHLRTAIVHILHPLDLVLPVHMCSCDHLIPCADNSPEVPSPSYQIVTKPVELPIEFLEPQLPKSW